MRLAYQYRLRPTKQQIATFLHWLELCRRQYNYRLAERFNWWDLNIIRSRPGVLCTTDEEFEAELQKRINSSPQET